MTPPPDAATQARLVAAATGATPPVALVDDPAKLRVLDLPSFFSASMAIMFLFFAAGFGMVSLFEERRNGTVARILAGPVRPWWILAGKMLGAFAISVIAMTILVVATTLLIRADWGPPAGVALLVLAGVIASLGISALVTSFATSAEAAGAANAAVAITLSILGGSFMPMTQAPEVMGTLALLTPHGWFIRGLGDLAVDGAPLADIAQPLLVLLAMGLVTGTLGMLRARRLVTAR
jgi:ABC-2 type transport system permease protein